MSRKSEMLKEIKERSEEELRNIVERAGRDEVSVTDMLGLQSENFLSERSIQRYIDCQDCVSYRCSKRVDSTLVKATGRKASFSGTRDTKKVYVNIENENDRIEVHKTELLYRFQ